MKFSILPVKIGKDRFYLPFKNIEKSLVIIVIKIVQTFLKIQKFKPKEIQNMIRLSINQEKPIIIS